MSKSAISIMIFGVYVSVLGLLLIAIPNLILGLLLQPETNEIWIRVAGVLLFLLGFYYIESARAELKRFFQLTVYARIAVMLFFIAFTIFLSATPLIIAFASVDVCGAAWTQLALNREKTK